MDNPQPLTNPKVVKALAHPLRVRLLATLDGRAASPSQLAKELGAKLGTVSYHVRTLHNLNLLRLVREERQRGAVEHYYTSVDYAVSRNTWANMPIPVRRAVSSSSISQIGEEVSSAAFSGGFDDPFSSHMSRSTPKLDEEGARRLAEELDGLLAKVSAIEAASEERLRASGSEGKRHELVLMMFETDDRPDRTRGAE